MTAYTWIGGTGDWDVAGNWSPSSPAGPPGATDIATISATGPAYTVTIDTADAAKSLTEDSSSATVDDAGSLTLSRTFTLSAGTFVLGDGGTLSGGTTKVEGGTFTCDGGTLDDVTYDGALDLSEFDASVILVSGTTVNNAAGTGPGTINDTGEQTGLSFDGTQTFNNATINLGNSTAPSFLGGTNLTLGPNVTIDESAYAHIYTDDDIVNQGNITQTGTDSNLTIYGPSGNSFTNSGTITAASSHGAMNIEITGFARTTFTNSGTLAVSNGDKVTIKPTTFATTASSLITIAANSSVDIDPTNAWSNLGSITLASGSSLHLGGSFTLAGLGTIANSGGTVYIHGTLDNTAGTLNGTTGLGQAVLHGGTVEGGTVTPAGLLLSTSGGTLSGVTYDGALDLSGSNVWVQIANGTVVNNAAGTGAGTINDTGEYSALYFDNAQTFNNATINLGAASGYESYLYEDDLTGAGTVLTLDSNVAADESGYAQIFAGSYSGDGIVNQGDINQSGTGSSLDISGNSFTNSGTITAASSGGALTIDPTTFTNSGTLAISNGDAVTIDATTASLGGTVNGSNVLKTEGPTTVSGLTIGGTVEWENTNTVTQSGGTVTIGDSSGDKAGLFNTATGTYDIADDNGIDRGSSKASYIKNAGLFEKTGGTGTSTIAPAVANSGTLEAASGTLEFKGAVTGTGTDEISGRATLEFYSTAAAGQTVSFTGSGGELLLHDPAGFAGSISDFDMAGAGSNDTIRIASPWDFIGFTENANGMEGTLGFSNGSSTLSLTLIGDYTAKDFVHHMGPRGSTLITYT
jgi:hypothetical protein